MHETKPLRHAATAFAGAVLFAFMWAPVASADSYNEPMPYTSLSPPDGTTVTAGQPVTFNITGAPTPMTMSVKVSTQNLPGVDGTLADDFQVDFFVPFGSDAFPGTYTHTTPNYGSGCGAFFWVCKPGTYYWQASGLYDDTSVEPNVLHWYKTPVQRLTVVAPTSSPPPSSQPPASPPPQHVDLSMSGSDARYYARAMIRRKTHHAAHNLHSRCSRRSFKSFGCKLNWYDGVKYVYAGTATFTHHSNSDGDVYATFSFKGLRGTVSCLNHHSVKRCAHKVRW